MPIIIDPQFVDVAFDRQPQYVEGAKPSNPFRGQRIYEAEVPQIPESQWQAEYEKIAEEGGLEWYIQWLLNQLSEGSCVGNMATYMHHVQQAKTFGLDKVIQLSPISMYQLIGSSAQSGASIDDALEEGSNTGFVPLDTPENRAKFGTVVMPATGWRTKRPTGWEAVATQFRYDETFVIQSVGGMMSALFNGHPVGVGREGHSILYLKPIFQNGRWYVMYVNSWGPWGQAAGRMSAGFGFDTVSQFRKSAQWAYACRTIINPFALAA